MNLWKLISKESLQYGVFIGLSLFIFVLTTATYLSNSPSFQRFFGRLNPLAVVFAVFIVGLISLSFLLSENKFVIYERANIKGLILAAGLALPFAAAMILVDWRAVLPADINVPFPESLMFYPAIGYVVEIIFHVLPLALLYFFLSTLNPEMSDTRVIWISILIVALIEPIFQTALSSDQNSMWTTAYIGLHIWMINLVQLLLFRRYDFITMYSFRLVYYLLWHIAWGHLRLNLLF